MVKATKQAKPLSVASEDYFKENKEGLMTLQYPHQSLPVPDNARYRLHNEIDDCIVCDKCAKICPVDCIDIEPIRSAEEIGKTSDGTSKRIYAAKFDIDMGKCCFCGLCTTVCPTECLTMTKTYDFSEYDINDHNYAFAEMTPIEILTKQKEWDQHAAAKEAAKAQKAAAAPAQQETSKPAGKPSFKPRVKPATASKEGDDPKAMALKLMQDKKKAQETSDASSQLANKPKPVFRPKVKVTPKSSEAAPDQNEALAKPKIKPVMKPKVQSKAKTDEPTVNKPKAVAKPVIKPKIKPKSAAPDQSEEQPKRPKPVIKPKIKPVIKATDEETPPADQPKQEAPKKIKPVIPKKKKED